MRGGLDDALDKLARRDELRRRAAGEATGTPPAVQELVEAIAAVVGRNPKLAVTVGVEGAGDPVLLHFAVEDGVVQVNVDNSVAARVAEASPPKHADFDLEPEEPPVYTEPPPAPADDSRRRFSYDDSNRFDPGTGYPDETYGGQGAPYFAGPLAAEHRYESRGRYEEAAPDAFAEPGGFAGSARVAGSASGGASGGASGSAGSAPGADFARSGSASDAGSSGSASAAGYARSGTNGSASAPHPFAAPPPPPVPPRTSRPPHTEQHRAPEEPQPALRVPGRRGGSHDTPTVQHGGGPADASSMPRGPAHVPGGPAYVPGGPAYVPGSSAHAPGGSVHAPPAQRGSGPEDAPSVPRGGPANAPSMPRGMPTPLPKPIPLTVDSEETELAAKRLSALLRDNPSLLRPSASD